MDYCGPRGIPLSQFLRWDQADQDVALAWQAEQSRRCGVCKTHPDEWDPAAGGSRDAYTPAVDVCPGCARIHTGQLMHREALDNIAGSRLVLTRNPDPQR